MPCFYTIFTPERFDTSSIINWHNVCTPPRVLTHKQIALRFCTNKLLHKPAFKQTCLYFMVFTPELFWHQHLFTSRLTFLTKYSHNPIWSCTNILHQPTSACDRQRLCNWPCPLQVQQLLHLAWKGVHILKHFDAWPAVPIELLLVA